MTSRAEILAVGDELLRGITQDTNSPWIASRLWAAGLEVTRMSVVPDDPDVVGAEVGAALERRAAVVVTTGGLGPTSDDRTLEGVARGTSRAVREDPDALEFVRRRYDELAGSGGIDEGGLTPERRKMAGLPRGSRLLVNDVGTAPGAALDLERALVLSLPGVPGEMKPMWEGPVSELLRRRFGASGYAEEIVVVTCDDESVLAPVVERVGERHPRVYVKSRAERFERGRGLRVSLTSGGTDDDDARRRLQDALEELASEVGRLGYTIREPGGY